MLAAAGGAEFPLWSAAPFVLLLLAIATLPLVRSGWWHHNRNKALVGAIIALPVLVYVSFKDPSALGHTALEYGAFVALLGSLFTISGGIYVRGSLSGTPLGNTALMGVGAVLANLVGTTGAAMLLIRPLLKANRARKRGLTHLVVFFILIVANAGGLLTPLGDPPLFLGFLKGVPFEWTLRLWPQWLVAVGALLAIFNVFDQRAFVREDLATPKDLVDEVQPTERFGLDGAANLALLAGVVAVVLASGFFVHRRFGETTAQVTQAAAMAGLAWVSMRITPARIRKANDFSWHPFVEVMVLFAAIFVAMIPALAVLRAHGAELGLSRPWHFYAATGSLSAFLDNAPTYLAFLQTAAYLPDEVAGTTHATLAAISCAAVFFGALTYIGNGPNFMVRAIAEHAGVKMPSFFGYLGWALAILGPVLVLVGALFFR